jgi:hypothetical protein
MTSERDRKAAYLYVASLLERAAPPPELRAEVERIRDAMNAAGRQPELFAFDQLQQLQKVTHFDVQGEYAHQVGDVSKVKIGSGDQADKK